MTADEREYQEQRPKGWSYPTVLLSLLVLIRKGLKR